MSLTTSKVRSLQSLPLDYQKPSVLVVHRGTLQYHGMHHLGEAHCEVHTLI